LILKEFLRARFIAKRIALEGNQHVPFQAIANTMKKTGFFAKLP